MIPVPFNEQFRLAVLEHFDVLDSQPEDRFDRITRVASRCFDVPISVISLVASTRQWFKSTVGLAQSETAREISFCGHAILDPEVFVVLDAATDPRFADSPLVTSEPRIRFYAGAPLVSVKGFRFGTLCIIDREPRASFSKREREMLTDLAAMAVEELYRGYTRTADRAAAVSPGDSEASPSLAELRQFEREQAHRAQLLFVASLSHELRTPLNAIKGFSEVLAQQVFGPIDNERYLEYAEHICDSAAHLSRFVDSILDFVKTDKGEISLHEDWIDIATTAETCRTMFTEQVRRAGLRFVCEARPGLPALRADPQLVVQMLVNLIGNSIKFTEPGGTVCVTADRDRAGGLTLTVADTGIGIAPEDLHKVLIPFGQVDNTMTRALGGTGLGLSLTKQFVSLHGGDLDIDSEPGVGTAVHLRFPAYRVAD